MSAIKIGFALVFAVVLSGCGTYTPDIQEFWGTRGDAKSKVANISGQVICELRRAVQQIYWDRQNNPTQFVPDPALPPPTPRDLKWFNAWSVQVTLNLNIAESTAVAPGGSFPKVLHNVVSPFPVGGNVTTSQSSAVGLGGSLSSTATRTDKLNMFFTVEELRTGTASRGKTCIPSHHANADLFIESDLKLYDWLSDALLPYDAGVINYESNTAQNGITHEVKFQIVSTGNVTPTWKLVHFTANTSGTFFSMGRDRTQDLTITFGPAQKDKDGKNTRQLATPAANSHLAADIGAAVAQALKGSQ